MQNVQLTLTNQVRLQSIPVINAGDLWVGMTIEPLSYYEILGCQLSGLDPQPDSSGVFPASALTTATYSFNLLPGNYQVEVAYTNSGTTVPDDLPFIMVFGGSVITTSSLVFGEIGRAHV